MSVIVLGRHVLILVESSSGPPKNTDPYLAMFKNLHSILQLTGQDDSENIYCY